MYIRYMWYISGFFASNLYPKQRRRRGAYISNAKLLRQASKGPRGSKGGARLLEEAKRSLAKRFKLLEGYGVQRLTRCKTNTHARGGSILCIPAGTAGIHSICRMPRKVVG